MKTSLLQRLPHVFFTCLAFDLWFAGLVMIQHNILTSLNRRFAMVRFSSRWTKPSSSRNPTSVSGPMNRSVDSRSHCRGSVTDDVMSIVASEKPTKTPNVKMSNDLRLNKFRGPVEGWQYWNYCRVTTINCHLLHHFFCLVCQTFYSYGLMHVGGPCSPFL